MYEHETQRHKRFYKKTIHHINQTFDVPDDLCFVYVQHAFSPLVKHFSCIGNRLAAVIPKGSSAGGNPQVVAKLNQMFPGRILANVTRKHLRDINYTVQLLKDITRGRPFAILEYGGYFAPAAEAIANDRYLGPKLAGFVEGTENGIRGSDDGNTIGYQQVAAQVNRPIVSKSRSGIKKIMDLEIGPAIVESCNDILRRRQGCRLQHWRGQIGIVGIGSIGSGVLNKLNKYNKNPMVYDADLTVQTELACKQYQVVSRQTILSQSDILFLNTGSCFLSRQPELLDTLRDYSLLVLCTSGDVEAGIPQLIESGHISLVQSQSNDEIAVYRTCFGKHLRVMLGRDGIGQAPNMVVADGSGSPANLMSDMEFYALGAYLSNNQNALPTGSIIESPETVQDLILEQWLNEFHPSSLETAPLLQRTVASSSKSRNINKKQLLDTAV